jgi:hypothetical protein
MFEELLSKEIEITDNIVTAFFVKDSNTLSKGNGRFD